MIDPTQVLSLFEELATIDSPSFGERDVCDRITSYLRDLGLNPQEDNTAEALHGNCGNLYCYVDGTLDLPPLLFSAHMDTVEPSRCKKAVIQEDGTITSDGSTVLGADDCAGQTAILTALAALLHSGLPHRPIELVFSVAEESYCAGIRHFDFSRLRSKEAYVFDLSGPVGGAAYQAPALLSFTAEFTGRSAHAGFAPEDGAHAIQAAAQGVSNLTCGHVGDATINVGTITGGTADNIVPDRCTITGEIRSFSNEEAQTLLEELTNTLRQSAGPLGVAVEVRHTFQFSACCVPLDDPVICRFRNACRETGVASALIRTFGGSDNNYFAQHGLTGLVAATAMNNCHSCREYTSKEELTRASALALRLMLSEE